MNKRALLLLVSVLPFSAFLAQAETVGEALAKCSETKNSLQRLVCYDRVEKQVNRLSGTQAGIPVAIPSNTPTVASERRREVPVSQAPAPKGEQFGLEHTEKLADSFTGTINKITKTARGNLILTFNDGSVWQQTTSTELKLKEDETVMIQRGMMGAFYMKKEGHNKRMKVKRVK
ncbi:hypothetical protein ALT761_00480 [Alteromonas sp. 76-1]|jgi:hypothetical protein|uniref:hypothetical protein n=1 Tax=Alteromonas sp. 76-1 TaxID=2358187 RepID=UPI000FD1718D|nr:hypothetical protein [Alteromonas sp. 76-1]VEL95526.1 hypothetical protein ALT761_00480 [Alteromonas sp. 76-1]